MESGPERKIYIKMDNLKKIAKIDAIYRRPVLFGMVEPITM